MSSLAKAPVAKLPHVIDGERSVTDVVLSAMESTPDERLKMVVGSFVRHMHDFVREVRPTEAEFEFGLGFLNRIGQATHDAHNEAVLFSDVIGLSTLVCLLNNGDSGATETAAALLGPFWRMHSPKTENGSSILRSPTPGEPLFVFGEIVDRDGHPIEGVELDVWQASTVGLYENQDASQAEMNLRGKFHTDAQGRFSFRSVKPAGYPIPTDGPVGDMLRAQRRDPFRPAHLHFLGFKTGFKTLITQIFVDDDQHLESDVVFGVTRHLIGGFQEISGPAPDPDVTGPWIRLDYRFVMETGEAKLPVPPIR